MLQEHQRCPSELEPCWPVTGWCLTWLDPASGNAHEPATSSLLSRLVSQFCGIRCLRQCLGERFADGRTGFCSCFAVGWKLWLEAVPIERASRACTGSARSYCLLFSAQLSFMKQLFLEHLLLHSCSSLVIVGACCFCIILADVMCVTGSDSLHQSGDSTHSSWRLSCIAYEVEIGYQRHVCQ